MRDIKVKILLDDGASPPKYMTEGASGADIFAYEDTIIPSREAVLVRTGIRLEIEEGYECQVRPRSGYSFKNKILILNSPGTVDSDYRGEIKIIMYNMNDCDFTVRKNDRIAQIVFAPVLRAVFEESVLKESRRGDGGFGHTGGM